ncbi:MAG: hypothetical protein IKQ46_04745 [Bacteroidales bacterium]|nr:hypothetical protein [Bacteroidales bacterium]MBR6298312.1 hypothetical protein [Candidatus Gastranaerophilales bacterium]
MKKIFISAAVVAASVFGVCTANQNSAMAQMSDLLLEESEVLADGECVGTLEGWNYSCTGDTRKCFDYRDDHQSMSCPGVMAVWR